MYLYIAVIPISDLPPVDIRGLLVDKSVILVILMSPAYVILITHLSERVHVSSGTQVLLYL